MTPTLRFELSSEYGAAALALSRSQLAFLEQLEREPALLHRESFAGMFEPDMIVEDAVHPSPIRSAIQPWPTFVRRDFVQRNAEGAWAIERSLEGCLRRHLQTEPEVVRALFGGTRDRELDLLGGGLSARMLRADAVETTTGMKIVELNVCGALGGWYTLLLANRARDIPCLGALFAGLPSARAQSPMEGLFRSVRKVLGDSGRALGFALSSDDLPEEAYAFYEAAISGMWMTLLGTDPPRVIVSPTAELVWNGGTLAHEGVAIGALVDASLPLPDTDAVFAAAAAQVAMYNGPLSALLMDKRCLAWLSSHQDELDEGERLRVESLLPWTRSLRAGTSASFRGERASFEALLEHARPDLVLKPGFGYGGKGIVIGREASPAAWEAASREALAEGSWVLQEHVQSVLRPFQWGEDGCVPCKTVWGFFACDGEPWGSFIRMKPDDSDGIVNRSSGGQVGVVFEVDES